MFLRLLLIILTLICCSSDSKPQKQLLNPAQHNSFNSIDCGIRLSHRRVRRIVGGRKSKAHQWPWAVAIHGGNDNFKCGGALISKLWVITAAHCLPLLKTDQKRFRLILGTNDNSKPFSKSAQHRTIKQAFVHPKFTGNVHDGFDIGLIKMNRPVSLNRYVNTVCLANTEQKEPKVGENCILTGWGRASLTEERHSNLWEVSQTVIGRDECTWKNEEAATDKVICTYNWLQSGCHGDSGSSLVYKKYNRWYSVGLLSWSKTILCGHEPSVFTRVRKMIPWIEKTLKSN